ncbi:energy-coupling factor ABC transporter permease [Halorutilales archaeon Cl-col2-1]
MAHIHLPDGVIPVWAVALWYLVGGVVVAGAVWKLRSGETETRKIALGGMAAAASFAVFQLNLPVLGGVHLNLTPLVGVLAGPALGSLIALVVNVLSAMLGHGAWGFLGANTLVNATEVTVAYYVFVSLRRMNWNAFVSSSLSAMAGLGVGSLLMGGIPLVSGLNGVELGGSDLAVYMGALVALNLGVAVVESLVTGFIVTYIVKLRPDLVSGGLLPSESAAGSQNENAEVSA